ncbi:addiction module antidote protein [Pseudomonas sp. KCJK9009]|uniref:addiction module antidote protein n=1 Tax=Pseudomonas sp. KCJK9009 TaxID=3344561 RepID=UPI003905DC7D
MMSKKISPQDMPILDLDLSKTKRFEASRFLDSPETIAAFLAEAMKANDAQTLMHALGEVAKAKGVNQFAQDAGVNRESLYETLKGGGTMRTSRGKSTQGHCHG